MKAHGDTRFGRSPAAVLAATQANPGLYRGRNVVLSSGASNAPGQVGLVEQQIAALHAAGAAGITVLGVGSRFSGVNERLAQIAARCGAHFAGPLATGPDHVHPRSYRALAASLNSLGAGSVTPHVDDRHIDNAIRKVRHLHSLLRATERHGPHRGAQLTHDDVARHHLDNRYQSSRQQGT
jgi:hypothetical protein